MSLHHFLCETTRKFSEIEIELCLAQKGLNWADFFVRGISIGNIRRPRTLPNRYIWCL